MPDGTTLTGAPPTAAPAAPAAPLTSKPPLAYNGRGSAQRFGASERRDSWWASPAAIALGLIGVFIYAAWAAFSGKYFSYTDGGRHYLSPFYSPEWHPAWWPLSPALIILLVPLGFRGTCYYFRRAYYRAFFADPPACAVGEARGCGYTGERAMPLVLQNAHRFFLYLALIYLVVLWVDVGKSFNIAGRFGIGVGTLVLLVDNTLLTFYTFSCHSLRHLAGGCIDCFSASAPNRWRYKVWRAVSWLNADGRHGLWAWISMYGACAADLYIRLCAMGVIRDGRIL